MSVSFYDLIWNKIQRNTYRLLHGSEHVRYLVVAIDVSEDEQVSSERSELVSFHIQKQRELKYRTKHYPCCNLLYLLRFSPSTRFMPFIRHNKCQVYMFLFRLSTSTLSLLQKPSVNIFVYLVNVSAAFDLFPLPFLQVVCFELP